MKRTLPVCLPVVCLLVVAATGLSAEDDDLKSTAVAQLLKCQDDEGRWPYEGVYRVDGEIPVGYRIGGTAIVAGALLHAAPEDPAATAAIESGVAFIIDALGHPLMKPSVKDAYDVRVWGHGYALELLCRLRAAKRFGAHENAIREWIPKLVTALVTEELDGGGWNYATRRQHAAFVTAPVTQSLLLARSQGEKIPDEVFDRARSALERSHDASSGYFEYSGPLSPRVDGKKALPGSIARSPICETTLLLLGAGSETRIQASLDAFHEHWNELEKRRKKTGTHDGPYAIAPYYFYYGHRYAAQAIEFLPERDRPRERAKLLAVIRKTRDEDGTWNDRVFERSKAYGTAMIVHALLGAKQPLPPRLEK
jgi:hypothetical protein